MPAPFSDTVMEYFFHPRNVGQLPVPCGEGVAGSVERGVFMKMYANVTDNVVTEARYLTYGCVPAIAAGSMLTEWVQGRPTDEALCYTSDQLTIALDGLPTERRFCADLAIEAMQLAVQNALDLSQSGVATP